MKKLLMTMVLVGCVVAVSAQGLPRRTLGTRFPGQSAAVTPKQKQNVVTTNGVEWTYRVVDDAVILEGIVSERREKIRGKGLAVVRSISASIPKNTSGDLTIPDTIAGKSVRCIGCNAFYYCDKLTSVAIPSSVTNIGDNAFAGCRGLTSITIQPGVTSIGVRAFSGCCGLATIMIPPCVTSIGEDAFYGCSGLTSVTIQPSVTSIGDRAFSGCSELTAIVIPSGVKSIGRAAFSCCSNLTSVTIPSSVTNIGVCAFYECNGLTSVTIPPGVTSIRTGAFSGCSGLADVNGCVVVNGVLYDYLGDTSSVAIPSSVTRIGEYAFSNEMIAKIGAVPQRRPSQAARGADRAGQGFAISNNFGNLTSVAIPSSVTNIGSGAFWNCHGLKRIDITDLAKWCEVFICDSGSNPLGYAHHLYLNGEEVKDLMIPEGVTEIKKGVFSECAWLTSVTIPSSVTNIGDFAFSGCKGLTSVTIPSSVTSIGRKAFYGCGGLMSITIPLGVTSIGEEAFRECRGLMSVSIPSSVTRIGSGAFELCRDLKRVNITDLAKWREISFGRNGLGGWVNPDIYLNGEEVKGRPLSKTVNSFSSSADSAAQNERVYVITTNGVVWTCRVVNDAVILQGTDVIYRRHFRLPVVTAIPKNTSGDLIIPDTIVGKPVRCIGRNAFYGCDKLTSVTLPSGVTSIGDGAFSDCTGLTSVMIPSNVTSIGKSAFSRCEKLGSVRIPFGVTSIGNDAFYECRSLTSITIPSSVTNIGANAFAGCRSLTTMKIPTSVMCIGGGAFAQCESLTLLSIPARFRLWGVGLSDLPMKVEIPEGEGVIVRGAFSSCHRITEVVIPASVTNISSDAFTFCGDLKRIAVADANKYYKSVDGLLLTRDGNRLIAGVNGEVIIPSGVKCVEDEAFIGYDGVMSVTIPASVTTIGSRAFAKCSKLTRFVVATANKSYKSVNGLLLTRDGSRLVAGVNGDVVIPPGVKSIEDEAFFGCAGLRSVLMPKGVMSIGHSAFDECKGLTSVSVPSRLDRILSFVGNILRVPGNRIIVRG